MRLRTTAIGSAMILGGMATGAAAITFAGSASAASAASPNGVAQTLNIDFNTPIEGGADSETTIVEASAPTTVDAGAQYQETLAEPPQVVPDEEQAPIVGTTSVSFTYGYHFIYPIPAGATFDSATLSADTASYTGGVVTTDDLDYPLPAGAPSTTPLVPIATKGTVPVGYTYCTGSVNATPPTSTNADCTALPNGPNADLATGGGSEAPFNGTTSTPYIEISTPGGEAPFSVTENYLGPQAAPPADCVTAGSTLSMPSLAMTLTASGTAGTTVNQTFSEYDATGNAEYGQADGQVWGWPGTFVPVPDDPTAYPIPDGDVGSFPVPGVIVPTLASTDIVAATTPTSTSTAPTTTATAPTTTATAPTTTATAPTTTATAPTTTATAPTTTATAPTTTATAPTTTATAPTTTATAPTTTATAPTTTATAPTTTGTGTGTTSPTTATGTGTGTTPPTTAPPGTNPETTSPAADPSELGDDSSEGAQEESETAAQTPAYNTGSEGGGSLAYTGASVMISLIVAGFMIIGGIAVLLTSRRRANR